MAHDADAGDAGRGPPPEGPGPETYLRRLADSELRWVLQQINAPAGGINGHGFTDIALIPPLHPAATSLEVILTGPTAQAVATTPLNWQPLR